jgi:hypothetical protein
VRGSVAADAGSATAEDCVVVEVVLAPAVEVVLAPAVDGEVAGAGDVDGAELDDGVGVVDGDEE